MAHWRLAIAVVLVAVPARAEQPSPAQQIALTDKPAVVRVWGAYRGTFTIGSKRLEEWTGGTGSGFFITPDGYIATNAHVVADIHDGDDAAKATLQGKLFKDLEKYAGDELRRLNAAQLQALRESIHLVGLERHAYVVLPNGDKLNYEVKEYGKPGTGRDCAIIKVKIENAPTLPIGDSKRSQVEDHIVVIGYPGVADFKDLLDDKSQLEASITDGAISSLKRAASGEQILQISAPITHGNSGGPAIDQHGTVVGLATFANEGEVQGFNFLVASATLQELVTEAKIKPGEGETDRAWREGLDHYWADEYTDAIGKFEEVETLFPQHSEAARLIRLSHQAQKDGKEKKPSNTGAIIGASIGGGCLLLLVIVLVVRKGKGKAKAKAPPGPQPVAQPGQPMMPQPMMYGRAPAPSGPVAPVAKTMAIQPGQSGGIAPTAFGSMSIGSLTCTRGQLYGQRFALTPAGIIVGRQPGVAHVLINDHRASGKHVWIGLESGRLVAIDQGTTNGTYINDVTRGRISRAELRDGDIVIVGEPDCLSLQVRLS
jgi:S1-C subfamily serine protease